MTRVQKIYVWLLFAFVVILPISSVSLAKTNYTIGAWVTAAVWMVTGVILWSEWRALQKRD